MKVLFFNTKSSNSILTFALTFCLGVIANAKAPANISNFSSEEEKFAAEQILVKARSGVSEQALDKELAKFGAKKIEKINGVDIHIVSLPPHANEKALAALMAKNPHFEFAEVDRLVPGAGSTNDPFLPYQWGVYKTETQLAWDYTVGASQIIAVVDSGVNASHPDLVGKLVPGWNFYDNNNDTSDAYSGDWGHGTPVAGTIAAVGNNNFGMSGIAYGAKIMPLRASDSTGYALYSTLTKAVTHAADNGIRIANLSYSFTGCASSLQSVATYMKNKGGVVISSAGNDGKSDYCTCADSDLVVVSATLSDDTRASWSSFGSCVDVSAPGNGITCTRKAGDVQNGCWGTSFAAPIVSGIVALMLDANPKLSPAQVSTLLRQSSQDLGAAGYDPYFGYGRVNAARAVAAARDAITQTSDTQAPTGSLLSPANGAIVKGAVAIDVAASDNVGVARVELFVNGVLTATDTMSPYNFTYDSTMVADGSLSVQAKIHDTSGNIGLSATHKVTVDNVADPIDTTAPLVKIHAPLDGANVSQLRSSLTVSASATDDTLVTAMKVYVDGVLRISSSTSSISGSINIKKLSRGTHTIKVEALDQAGNVGSATVYIIK